jgi:hypothetical protein
LFSIGFKINGVEQITQFSKPVVYRPRASLISAEAEKALWLGGLLDSHLHKRMWPARFPIAATWHGRHSLPAKVGTSYAALNSRQYGAN